MGKPKKKPKPKRGTPPPRSLVAAFHGSALQKIRQHARTSPQMEICGALIGRYSDGRTLVVGAVAGAGAAQGGAHVTFTQEAWTKIHEEKADKFPDDAIVGWYHSHPGFGVFLSDHDLFIHKNFFAESGHLAWVFDPHSDEEGCFGWDKGEVKRIERVELLADVVNEPENSTEPELPGFHKRPLMTKKRLTSVLRTLIRDAALVGTGIVIGVIAIFSWMLISPTRFHGRIDGKPTGSHFAPRPDHPQSTVTQKIPELRGWAAMPSANTPTANQTSTIDKTNPQTDGGPDGQR